MKGTLWSFEACRQDHSQHAAGARTNILEGVNLLAVQRWRHYLLDHAQ